ncbi:Aldehyde oxidase GLOX1 [Linum perenne]
MELSLLFHLPLLSLLFISVSSHEKLAEPPGQFVDPKVLNAEKPLGPHEKFGDPFGNPGDYKEKKLPNDFGTPGLTSLETQKFVGDGISPAAAPDVEVALSVADEYKGKFELFTNNSGVSAMHTIVLPNCDNVLMYDATIWRISNIMLPNGECRILNQATGEKDCYAHSVLLNYKTAELIPLMVVSTGGFQGGANTVRYLEKCPTCTWKEYPAALSAPRWYSTQAQLADGRMIVIGGRGAQSFEYIPPEGTNNNKPFFFDFLQQTADPDENNLYPFVFLSPDKNVFVFANNRGMAVLLPLVVKTNEPNEIVQAEVLICGGSAHINSYTLASKDMFYEGLQDCGRLIITRPRPNWRRELMPTSRIMGDMVRTYVQLITMSILIILIPFN